MGAAAWLAEFARRDDGWREQRAAYHREVGERIRAELAPVVRPVPRPVVLEGPRVFADEDEMAAVPAVVRRHWNAALGTGWSAKAVRAAAAVAGLGVLETWSLRCARHDERLIAVWWITQGQDGKPSTSFNLGCYQGPAAVGLEQLGVETVEGRARAIMKAVLAGKKVVPAALTRRGLMDAINGMRLP